MSKLFSLKLPDWGKSLLIAFLTAFLGGLYTALRAGVFPTLDQLGAWSLSGLAAAVAYLLKNFFTNSQNQLLKPEPK